MSLPYSYVPAIPQGNQQVNNTQSPIKNNFYDIYDIYAVNHIPFNTPDEFGKHFNINYYNQNSDPGGIPSAISLYSKAVVNDTNILELFYQYPNGNVAQLNNTTEQIIPPPPTNTNGGIIYSTNPTPGYTGYQYLSGGLLMKFGFAYLGPYTPGASTPPVMYYNFPLDPSIPVFSTTPYTMQWGLQKGNTANTPAKPTITGIFPFSSTQFQYQLVGDTYSLAYIYWLAIGI